MKTRAVIFIMLASLTGAQAASGRYSCDADKHSISFDFGKKVLTLDNASDALVQGAATYRAKPGGHVVIISPTDKPRIFDVSIDNGSVYSGFVICKSY
jgi:hypothetical protein